jgi:hypothetical protein
MRPSAGALIVAGLVAAIGSAEGQVDASAPWLRGVVRDSAGAALGGARLRVVGAALVAVSDDSGTFRLPLAAGGRLRLEVRRLGYAAETLVVAVRASGESRLPIVLTRLTAEQLPELRIASATAGKMSGFERRRAHGVGSFITREEIEARHPQRVSDLLRYTSGVYVGQESSSQRNAEVGMRRSMGNSQLAPCEVQYYVDGQYYAGGSVDDFPPVTIQGIEIYRSASEIPAEFRARDATCGVIAIWTRDPPSTRGRPPAHP